MKPYKHFTLEERICLEELLKKGKSFRQIAQILDRSPSTISREVNRNFSVKKKRYNHWRATVLYIMRRRKCVRKPVIIANFELYCYIQDKLNSYWSPEIISCRGKHDGYSVSTSTIYRAVKDGIFTNISPKTHLRRRGKKLYNKSSNFNSIHPEHTIHDRPDIVNQKSRFGDFEGDTVYGAVGKGCIVTMVDRKSKLLLASLSPDRNNQSIRKAINVAFNMLNCNFPVNTITLDNGSEFAAFKEFEKDLNTTVYFADPHSPWQRALNENTNDMLRFFFPKGTNFLEVSEEELQSVVSLINNRPRKCLDYLSPLEFISKKCCT